MTEADGCQRWRDGRDAYRPRGEPIDPGRYEVAAIADDTTAKAFVTRHHYSGSYPAARFRFGLYRGAGLAGVAVLSQPVNDRTLTGPLPGVAPPDAAELGRFVLLDDVPANGETWFLGRCFRLLRREGLAGVVSFSDPGRRVNRHGATVFGGHVGTIYQAHNGAYLGRGTARTLLLLPDGSVLHARAVQKIRRAERGVDYAIDLLVRQGATPPRARRPAVLVAWLRHWTGRLCRRVRHRGNHRYAWALGRGVRLPASLPYPKQLDPETP